MQRLFTEAERVDPDKSNGSLTCNMILSLEGGLRMGGGAPPSVLPVGHHCSAAHCLCVMGQEDKSSLLSGFANSHRKMIALGAYFWHHINKK